MTGDDEVTVAPSPMKGLVLPASADPVGDARRDLTDQLIEEARVTGVSLVGPGGLLFDITKRVLETGLEVEMSEHLGYDKHAVDGRDGGNSRNGTRSKTVITEIGPVELDVPRDRAGTFEPQTVRKRQRRLEGVDAMVVSLTAKGLTTGEVQAHLVKVLGTDVSRGTISKITDAVLEDMADWLMRPLDRVYPVVFIDAIHVKVCDGQVANRPFYCAIGVTVEGKRDILGIWASPGAEGAKFWLNVLTELKNRGIAQSRAPTLASGSSCSREPAGSVDAAMACRSSARDQRGVPGGAPPSEPTAA